MCAAKGKGWGARHRKVFAASMRLVWDELSAGKQFFQSVMRQYARSPECGPADILAPGCGRAAAMGPS